MSECGSGCVSDMLVNTRANHSGMAAFGLYGRPGERKKGNELVDAEKWQLRRTRLSDIKENSDSESDQERGRGTQAKHVLVLGDGMHSK